MSTIDEKELGFQMEIHNRQKPKYLKRYRSLPRIYADNQDKRIMLIFWGSLIILAIITTTIALLLPSTFITLENQTSLSDTYLKNCQYPIEFNQSLNLICGSFNVSNPKAGLVMHDVGVANQFAFLHLHYQLKNTSNQAISKFQINQLGTMVLYTLQYEQQNKNIFTQNQLLDKQQNIAFEANSNSQAWEKDKIFIGFKSQIGYMRKITHRNYLIRISLTNSSQLQNVSNMYITATTINPQVTMFSIIIRLVFFSISGLNAAHYWYYYFFRTSSEEKILQQHIICFLSFLLILFNDPLYSVTILVPNRVTNVFSVLVVINFVIFLLFLWVIFLRRIHYENGEKNSTVAIRWWVMVYFAMLFVLLLGYYMLIAFYHIGEAPIIPSTYSKMRAFLVLRIFTYIWVGVGFLYIVGLYAFNFYNWKEKIWRNKFFLIFSIFFFIILFVGFLLGQWSIYDQTAARTMVWYMSLNVFTIYIQKMYIITPEGYQNLHQYFAKTDIFKLFGTKDIGKKSKLLQKQNEVSQRNDTLELTQENIYAQHKKQELMHFQDEEAFQHEINIDNKQ